MRKIAVFTGTRAEYGLLRWVVHDLAQADEVELQLLVGGMHLSPEFGRTVTEIEADQLPIAECLEFVLSSDTAVGTSKAMGLATISAAEALQRRKPDLLVVLGDRYEAIAVALAAVPARIPIAHIHGGELSEGAIDDAFRHALTKLSHLHFTSTEAYRRRVIQLGEDPDRVFNVGAPGLDAVDRLPPLSSAELSRDLDFDLDRPFFLVTFHPVTLDADHGIAAMRALTAALDAYPEHGAVVTYPNSDAGGRGVIAEWQAFQRDHPDRVLLTASLGQHRYLSALRLAAAVIGNSSSGIIEAPALGVPTVDVGDRQLGRVRASSVVHAEEDADSIRSAIAAVLAPGFRERLADTANPYGKGGASRRIFERLTTVPLEGLLDKRFHDMAVTA